MKKRISLACLCVVVVTLATLLLGSGKPASARSCCSDNQITATSSPSEAYGYVELEAGSYPRHYGTTTFSTTFAPGSTVRYYVSLTKCVNGWKYAGSAYSPYLSPGQDATVNVNLVNVYLAC